jgi:hypothetical protein
MDEECAGKRLSDISPITQVYTYSCAMESRFCVLTTGQFTWFIRRNDEDIEISKAFSPGSMSPSLAQAWVTFLRLAVQELDRHSAAGKAKDYLVKLQSDKKASRRAAAKRGAKTRQHNKTAASVSNSSRAIAGEVMGDSLQLPLAEISCDFSPIESYGALNHGVAHRNRIHGFDSVVKIVDANKDKVGCDGLDREAKMYEELSDLWGTAIPSVVYTGPITLGRSALAITYEGQSLDRLQLDDIMARQELKRKACDALTALHQRGVVHGDLALRNIVVNPATKSVKLIDLGSASQIGSDPQAKARMEGELQTLSALLDQPLSRNTM